MIFENKKSNLIINNFPHGMDRHIFLKQGMAEQIAIIKAVYDNEFGVNIPYTTICKIAIHHLISVLNELSEEEAVKLLNTHHKEVIFL